MGKHTHCLPIKDKEVKPEVSSTILLMSGKELLTEIEKNEDPQFFVVRKAKDCPDKHKGGRLARRDSGTIGRVH
jgi:hypothetical protein